MTLQQIFNLAIAEAKKVDPRKPDQLKDNPYPDSGILYEPRLTAGRQKTNTKIKKVLAGIDMEGPEILLAHFLKADLVLAHHPLGQALANLAQAMPMQADLMHTQINVPINIAEGVLKKQIAKVDRAVAGVNHYRAVDMARHAGMNLMCLHTVTDNLAWDYIENKLKVKNQKLKLVRDVVDLLLEIPEYQEAKKRGAGPKIIAGSPKNRAGNVAATEFTGGTDGGKLIYPALARAGLGTIISMHMKEDSREQAEKNHINVIIAGHIASDSLGMNLLLDKLEKKGLKIIPTSGLIRMKRI